MYMSLKIALKTDMTKQKQSNHTHIYNIQKKPSFEYLKSFSKIHISQKRVRTKLKITFFEHEFVNKEMTVKHQKIINIVS